MIEILSMGPPQELIAFEYTVTWKIKDTASYEFIPQSEIVLNDVCTWVSNSFTKNFVIMECSPPVNIAGGNVDNRTAWRQQGSRVIRDQLAWNSTYELRCCESDATMFILRWV